MIFTTYVQERQPPISQGGDSIAKKSYTKEDQKDLVRLRLEHPHPRLRLENIDTRDQK